MKKKVKITLICLPIAVFLILGILAYCRYRSNVRLGEELRKEVDAWLTSIPKIPDDENGALVINKGLKLLGDLPEVFEEQRDPRIENESDAKILRDYLAENEEALSLIEKAFAYKKWAYTTEYEYYKWSETSFPDLLASRNAAKIYSLRGDIALLEDRKSDAVREYLNVVRLANTFSHERVIISRMSSIATCGIGLKRLLELASDSTLVQEDLSYALNILVKLHGDQGDASSMFTIEYYTFIMILADCLTGVKREIPQMTAELDSSGMKKQSKHPQSPFNLSRILFDYHQDVAMFRKYLEICRTVRPAEYYSLPEELKSREALYKKIGMPDLGSWKAVFAQIAVPDLSKFVRLFAKHETLFRGTIALFAIRLYQARNGRLPESLKALGDLVPKELLTDPFSGRSLIYRRKVDDFYLYSVGCNGVDDNCKDSKLIYEEDVSVENVPDIVFHAPPSSGK